MSMSHSNDIKPSSMVTSQNVTFYDENPAWDHVVKNELDDTYTYGQTDQVPLQEFLSRPLKIGNGAWVIGSDTLTVQEYNPWTLFFSNKRVINRINNFNLLKCSLKVKIVINATPFHYGLMLASYKPLQNFDTVSKNFRAPPIGYIDLVERTQRPHIIINATENQGGTLTLPFFWYKNWLSIPTSEWNDMGVIQLDVLSQLKHANDGLDSVYYTIYAWAENVVLSAPTLNNSSSLVTQSGDEYGKGVISKPASNIANMMQQLENLPYIGNYARATSMVARTTSIIAKQFGFARPNIIDSVKPVRPITFGNISNIDADDFSQKLSLDSKQELTIDPSTVGLHCCDQMTLKSIYSRFSYYTRFTIPASIVQETIMFQTYVGPTMYNVNQTEIHTTPVCFSALPFKYWTGSMKYRFQIVSSKFHKGRIKIVYDPYGLPLGEAEYNIAFTKIVDISDERDFEFVVNWSQPEAFKAVAPVSTVTANLPWTTSTTTMLSPNSNYYNGVLGVYIINEVTGPTNLSPTLDVIVSVAGGDDLSFAQPTTDMLNNLSYFPTPPLTVQSGEVDRDNCPMKSEVTDHLNEEQSIPNKIFSVHFGETIVSFRSLLKRYSRYYSELIDYNGAGLFHFQITVPNYPLYYGPSTTGLTTVGTTKWNLTQSTLLNYLTPAFVGARGAIRYKLLTDTGSQYRYFNHWAVQNSSLLNQPYSATSSTVTTNFSSFNRTRHNAGLDGMFINNSSNGTYLEYEVPFYSPYRFLGTKNITGNTNVINYNSYSHLVTSRMYNDESNFITFFISTGEDFSLFFYTGPPILYLQTPPTPF